MKKLIALAITLSFMATDVAAQGKYWIKFSNKDGTPYATNNPSAFLTAKSIARRTTYNITIDQTDLPVTPSYINQVASVPGVTVHYASKWINGVVATISNTSMALPIINNFSFVSTSAPVNRLRLQIPKLSADNSTIVSANRSSEVVSAQTRYEGRSFWQLGMVGAYCMHQNGFRGQGMTIAVLDAGFSNVDVNPVFDSLRNRGGILGTRDFVSGGNSVYEDNTHGAAVLSLMAAVKPYVIMGSAPMANYWLLRTEEAAIETPSEEYNWIRGAEFADSVGADILTTSLGYTTFDQSQYNHTHSQLDGKTINMSKAATMASRKGMFVLNAAGNENGSPWTKIGIPADADSICTVGAVDSTFKIANFSSVGPTADGRIKPDLCALGVQAWVSYKADGSCEAGNGTSFATPILAGAVACFWSVHTDFNNMRVLNTLKMNGSNSANPNNSLGWGVASMCAIPIGIEEISGKNQLPLQVIPNPFSGAFKIQLQDNFSGPLEVTVYNHLGAKVKSISFAEETSVLNCDLDGFASGIYFVKVSSGEKYAVKKVIKQ